MLVGLLRPRSGRRDGDVVDMLVARQLARARLQLGVAGAQQTQRRPEAVARLRRTGREATVDGRLSQADGLVGVTQLMLGERVDRNDALAVTNVLSHRHKTPYDGYLQCRMTVAGLTKKSDHDLFCKLCAPTHALNHLLPPGRNRASLETRGHSYQLPEYSTDLHKKSFLIRSLYSVVK